MFEEILEKFRSKETNETQIEKGRKKEVPDDRRKKQKKEEEGVPYLVKTLPETVPTCSEQRSGATLVSCDPGCSSSSPGAA